MKAETVGHVSEPALEHCSGTMPAQKSSSHSGVHPPKPDRTPQGAADEATRAYNPVEVARLLSAAQEATRRHSEATPEKYDAVLVNPPDCAAEATRAYSAEEVANLVSKTQGPAPAPPSFTDVESAVQVQYEDLAALSVRPPTFGEPPDAEPAEPTAAESTDAEPQGCLAFSQLEPVLDLPTNTQQFEPLARRVESAATLDDKRDRSRHRIVSLMLACLVAGAASLVLYRSHGALNSWWHTSGTAALPKRAFVNEGPRLVRLDIEIDPPGATLLLDGEPTSNPLRIAYPSDDAVHELRGEAPGYLTRTASIKFDRNVVVVLSLAKAHPQAQEKLP